MNQEKNEKQSESFFISLFKWKIDEKELKNQIENYNTLGLFQSARKIATALMIFSAVITIIFVIAGWFPFEEIWIDIILISILAFFVYKGKKWAMITTMVYWTAMKGLQVINGFALENFRASNVWGAIIWWAIFMGALWQAYQVERERSKNKT